MIERHYCAIPNCKVPALLFSEPPRCITHTSNLEDWYDRFEEVLSAVEMSSSEREWEQLVARNVIAGEVFREPVAAELYGHWARRADPHGTKRFRIAEIGSFCLLAAASGILGNATYDGVKALVRRLCEADEPVFKRFVASERYEEMRHRLHPHAPPVVGLSDEVEAVVRRRYRILVLRPTSPKRRRRDRSR